MVSCVYEERKKGFTGLELIQFVDSGFDPDLLSTEPPVKPKGNEVYVYKLPNGDPRWIGWKWDSHKWKTDGRKSMGDKSRNITFLRNDFMVMGPDNQPNRRFTRRSYHYKDYVVVYYMGDDSLAGNFPVKQMNFWDQRKPVTTHARKRPQGAIGSSLRPTSVQNGLGTMSSQRKRIDPEAILAVKRNRVTLVQEKCVFLVEGSKSSLRMNAVTLFPEQSCSCGLRGGDCWHIVACKLGIGLEAMPETTAASGDSGSKKKQNSSVTTENGGEPSQTNSQAATVECLGGDVSGTEEVIEVDLNEQEPRTDIGTLQRELVKPAPLPIFQRTTRRLVLPKSTADKNK